MRHVVRVALAALALAVASAPAGAQQASADSTPKKVMNAPDPLPRRGFNVVLLLGDMMGGDTQDAIPVAARKALADMKDFLPYKSYRLLDTQWIISGNAAGNAAAVTRLRGVDDQEYELELRASPAFAPGGAALSAIGITVNFRLRDSLDAASLDGRTPLQPKELGKADPAMLEISREIFNLERERDDLQLQVSKKRKQVEVGTMDPDEVRRAEQQLTAVTRRIADLKQSSAAASAKAAGRPVIDTSFRMDDGETVVVGTSKVKGGGKALIALLTVTSERSKASAK